MPLHWPLWMHDADLDHFMHTLQTEALCQSGARDAETMRGMIPISDAQAEPTGKRDHHPARFILIPDDHWRIMMSLPDRLRKRQSHRRDMHINLRRSTDELSQRISIRRRHILHGDAGALMIKLATGDSR